MVGGQPISQAHTWMRMANDTSNSGAGRCTWTRGGWRWWPPSGARTGCPGRWPSAGAPTARSSSQATIDEAAQISKMQENCNGIYYCGGQLKWKGLF
ncbi:unnamed protein product [Heterosigma akashiwo]